MDIMYFTKHSETRQILQVTTIISLLAVGSHSVPKCPPPPPPPPPCGSPITRAYYCHTAHSNRYDPVLIVHRIVTITRPWSINMD